MAMPPLFDPERSDTELVKPEILKDEILETELSVADSKSLEQPTESGFQIPSPCIVTVLSGITFVGSMSTGIVTIAIPIIAKDLHLPESLLLWFVNLRARR